ncbi:DctP family TRAP transporter solute-binding subunit [Bacillus sp. FJAT-45350]|uniref:DctP family TRAP transporter solute-binding subunit n=1 Tax=Bacillus sp. FJAT-45350 TaxID=2011014 RepID=UPI000BB9BD60|nr:DctP family TRAP transporter solute-binding subunit [Bacillus sp. FJAT-45350]
MKLNKHFIKVIGTAVIGAMALTACGGGSDTSTSSEPTEVENNGEVITIKVGHIAPPTHSFTLGMEALTEAITEETDGQVQFEIFGGGQLGGERDMVEQVQLGSLDMGVFTTAPASNFVNDLAVLDMPMLFRDRDHIYNTLDGEVGQDILASVNSQGFKAFSFWENGMRHLSNNKQEIRSVEDMKGLKMRSLENDMILETYRTLGADPTPIAWPEVYTSFQQGVVDGHDNAIGVIESTNMYEVQDHLSLVGLQYAAAILMMNEDKFNSLPSDVQEVFVRLGAEFADVQRSMTADLEAEQLELLAGHGMQIIETGDIDLDSFRTAVEPVYEKFSGQFGDLVERINAVE